MKKKKKNLLVYILNNLICLVNAEYLASVVTCVRASLLSMASEIEGREAHHLFNLSFLYFLEELAPSGEVACCRWASCGLTHNIFHAHDNE